jgi:pSer/pThr/pTyr-binding forkhead associated (FHA) protein/soluble lytic murein transglycosylase-like protein
VRLKLQALDSQRATMSNPSIASQRPEYWLQFRSGPFAGARFPISEGTTRVGRALDNHIVVEGENAATVSLYHLEISISDGFCRVRDLDSTNGTWINGERISEAEITAPANIRLGFQGAEFALIKESVAPVELDRTIEVPLQALPSTPIDGDTKDEAYEKLLASAVADARRVRGRGTHGQTLTIMRSMVKQAVTQMLHKTHRRFRIIGYSLLAALVAVSLFAALKITALRREKRAVDTHIRQIDGELQKAREGMETDQLLAQLGDYSQEGESVQRNLLYRLSALYGDSDFVTRELRSVMAEFGAEVYSIPPDFIERVNHYIEQDQGPDRPIIVRALSQARGQLLTIQRILRQQELPVDLAYIPLVESSLEAGKASEAGAVGPWQFTAPTAKAYGLRVDGEVDERKDLEKSTLASCKYLRDLILDFGTGSSVMLALAAYDSGTTTVKQAVSKTVRDPIKHRNFWYLYRSKALPRETREYVPRVFAAILIGRNPAHFGF